MMLSIFSGIAPDRVEVFLALVVRQIRVRLQPFDKADDVGQGTFEIVRHGVRERIQFFVAHLQIIGVAAAGLRRPASAR